MLAAKCAILLGSVTSAALGIIFVKVATARRGGNAGDVEEVSA